MTRNPTKILRIIASADPDSGGPLEGIMRHSEVWTNSGAATTTLVTLDSPRAPFIAESKVPVVALGSANVPGENTNKSAWSRFGLTGAYVPWLKKHVTEYDAVFVHGLWNFATFAAGMVLPDTRVPYFVYTHGMMDPWFKRTYPTKHLIKQLFWSVNHGRLLANAQSVCFTCEEEMRAARGVFLGHTDYTGTVVGYGTKPPHEAPENQIKAFYTAVPQVVGKPFLLFLSRIHPKKGCDLLISSFAEVAAHNPNLNLVVAGPDTLGWGKELAAQVAALGLQDRVHFPGGLFGDAKWGAYRQAEAFVLPSHQENFGIVVSEAISCGLPVLLSDKVNIWREITAGGAGLVEPDDLPGTKRLLSRWEGMSKSDRASMRVNGKNLFSKQFDINTTAPMLLDFVNSKLKGRHYG